jgi:hypothetical protein
MSKIPELVTRSVILGVTRYVYTLFMPVGLQSNLGGRISLEESGSIPTIQYALENSKETNAFCKGDSSFNSTWGHLSESLVHTVRPTLPVPRANH